MDIVTEIYQLIKKLPRSEVYNLISQISRSSVSIPSNIAEGGARSGAKDYKRFLEIALGSAFELETQLLIIQNVKSMLSELGENSEREGLLKTPERVSKSLELVCEEQKMIQRFIATLMSS